MKTESPMIAVASVSGRLDVPSYDERLLCCIKSSAMPSSFANARLHAVQSPVSIFNSATLPHGESSSYDSQPSDHVISSMNIKSFEAAVSSTEMLPSVSDDCELRCECADNHSPLLSTDSRLEVEYTSPSHVKSYCCETDSSITETTNKEDNSTLLQLQADDCKTFRPPPSENMKISVKSQPNKSRKSSLLTSLNGRSNTVNHSSLNSTKQSYSNSGKGSSSQVSDKLPVDALPELKSDSLRKSESVTDMKSNAEEGQSSSQSVISKPKNDCVRVIREVYENGQATEYFAMQLDYALDSGIGTIIIEPSRLGRETSQWLTIGSLLRRSALVMGSVSLLSGTVGRDWICLPSGALAAIMSMLHVVSWRPDPCSRYRVERNSRQLQRLPLHDVTCSAPVVLVKCENLFLRNLCYDSVSFASILVGGWRIYRLCSER